MLLLVHILYCKFTYPYRKCICVQYSQEYTLTLPIHILRFSWFIKVDSGIRLEKGFDWCHYERHGLSLDKWIKKVKWLPFHPFDKLLYGSFSKITWSPQSHSPIIFWGHDQLFKYSVWGTEYYCTVLVYV